MNFVSFFWHVSNKWVNSIYNVDTVYKHREWNDLVPGEMEQDTQCKDFNPLFRVVYTLKLRDFPVVFFNVLSHLITVD